MTATRQQLIATVRKCRRRAGVRAQDSGRGRAVERWRERPAREARS